MLCVCVGWWISGPRVLDVEIHNYFIYTSNTENFQEEILEEIGE